MGKTRRFFVGAALAVCMCLGTVVFDFGATPVSADDTVTCNPQTDSCGGIYIGYVEPGVWQVRNSSGTAVKTVTITTPGPVQFTGNQELPIGTYTIHLIEGPDDYTSVDDAAVATVNVIDTGGRIPSGIGQFSDPFWKQVIEDYKGMPRLKFIETLNQTVETCESAGNPNSEKCIFYSELNTMWNAKKEGLSVTDLLGMQSFQNYADDIGSDPELLALSLLLMGEEAPASSASLSQILAFGLPARVSVLGPADLQSQVENYYRYRIESRGNTVDEDVLAWAVQYQLDGVNPLFAEGGYTGWDPDKAQAFKNLMGTCTFDDYVAIAEHLKSEGNYFSALVALQDVMNESWYADNPDAYNSVLLSWEEELNGKIEETYAGSFYFADKSGDGIFSMADIELMDGSDSTTVRENLFGSLYAGKGHITANKKMEDRALNDGEFSFGLYHASDISQNGGSTSSLTPLVTATNGAAAASDGTGSIVFRVSRAKAGKWTEVRGVPEYSEIMDGDTPPPDNVVSFTGRQTGQTVWNGEVFSDLAVAEIAGSDSSIVYDSTIVNVDPFSVTYYGGTPISTAHLEETGGDATFVNYVLQRKGVETTLVNIRKEMDGRDLQDGEFTFQLCEDAECNTVLEEVTNNADGSVPFTKLTIDPSDWSDGLHTLYVREVIPANGADYVRYDVDNPLGSGEAIDFSFQVFSTIATVNGQPTLIVEAIGPESPYIFFVNEYEFDPPATMFSSGNLPARLLLALGFVLLCALVGFTYVRHRLAR